MGFTQEEVSDKRIRAEGFLEREPVSGDMMLGLFGQRIMDLHQRRAETAADTDISHGIERIEVEGKVVTAQGPLSDMERAAHKKTLESEAFDEARIAENAGMRAGRISITGATDRDKVRSAEQAKARANQDARMQKLLALQAALDDINSDIANLEIQIDALDELLAIIDSGETLDPNNPAHRKLLERSGIPKEKWGSVTREDIEDAKREREAERAAKEAQSKEFEEIKNSGDPKRINEAAAVLDINAVRGERHDLEDSLKANVTDTLEKRVDEGSVARQDVAAENVMEMDDDLFAGVLSVISEDFNTAASGETNQPEQDVEHEQEIAVAATPPAPGMG